MENKIKELEEKLLRKEQECERLKHDNAYKVGALEITIDNLKAENEELKKEQVEIKKYLGISSKTIMERLEELQEFRDSYKDKLYQLNQTLAEIKDFVENKMIPNDDTHIILQLISEVKDEN